MNRISHPDWVKLCVELNYVPNQNTKFLLLHIRNFGLAASPISAARKGVPMDRISHPDWVKLCVESNYTPN